MSESEILQQKVESFAKVQFQKARNTSVGVKAENVLKALQVRGEDGKRKAEVWIRQRPTVARAWDEIREFALNFLDRAERLRVAWNGETTKVNGVSREKKPERATRLSNTLKKTSDSNHAQL